MDTRFVMIKSSVLTNEMVNRSISLNVDTVRRAIFTESFLRFFEKDVEYAILEFNPEDEAAAALFVDEYWMTNEEMHEELKGEKVL